MKWIKLHENGAAIDVNIESAITSYEGEDGKCRIHFAGTRPLIVDESLRQVRIKRASPEIRY